MGAQVFPLVLVLVFVNAAKKFLGVLLEVSVGWAFILLRPWRTVTRATAFVLPNTKTYARRMEGFHSRREAIGFMFVKVSLG